jgi:hypothetical protein
MKSLLLMTLLVMTGGCVRVRMGSNPRPPPPPTQSRSEMRRGDIIRAKEVSARVIRANVIYAKEVNAGSGRVGRVIEDRDDETWERERSDGSIRVDELNADVIYAKEVRAQYIEAGEIRAKKVKIGR